MTSQSCSVEGCETKPYCKGMCSKHYLRFRRHGDTGTVLKTGPRFQDPAARFWEKVDKTDVCWLWCGTVTHDGYGRYWFDGAEVGAHRWAYENTIGPIPEEMQIDHLCRVRNCVNPAHMEVVTLQENLRRRDAEKTYCPQRHPLSGDNLILTKQGWRKCRECTVTAKRERRAVLRNAGLSSRGRPLKR